MEAKAIKDAQKKAAREKGRKGRADGMDAAEDVVTHAPRKWTDYRVSFHFPEPTELQPPLLKLDDVCFKYPSREDFGIKNFNLGVDMGSRVAIVGPNGGGKSTLMNLLSGDLTPTEGEEKGGGGWVRVRVRELGLES